MIGHGVGACARSDDVGAAGTVDRVVAGAARQHVGPGRARDRHAADELRCIDVLEIGDGHHVAERLVGAAEIDRGDGAQQQGVGSGAAVDRELGAAIGDRVVAAARDDDVGAAAAVDRVVAGAGGDDVDARRTLDRQRRCRDRRIEVLEIGDHDAVAGGLVGTGRDGEVDGRDAAGRCQHQRIGAGAAVDRGLGALIGDGVVAGIGIDDVGAARAIDRVVAQAARDRVGAGRTGDRNAGGQRRGVHILEIRDVGGIAAGLIGRAENDGRGGFEQQRVDAGSAIDRDLAAAIGDRVVAGARGDHVGAAAAVDHIVARAGRDRVGEGRPGHDERGGQRTGVQILEIGDADAVAGGLVRARRHGEIDRAQGRAGRDDQRVGAGIAVDRDFGAVIQNRVVAGTGIDDISAAATVDRVVAGTGRDRVGGRRARDRNRRAQRRRVDVLEIGDVGRIGGGLVDIGEIDGRRRFHHQRIGAGAAVDRQFRTVIGDRIVAAAGCDDVSTTAAVDRVVARAAGDQVRARCAGDGHRRRQRRGVHVLEVRYGCGVAGRLIGIAEIDRDGGFHDQRIGAGATIDRDLGIVVGDGVVSGAGIDDISATAAVDRVVA